MTVVTDNGSRRFDRNPKQSDPTLAGSPLVIGLDVITDPMWMGGIIYIRNLVYCLACLPDDERPEIRLLGVPDDSLPLVQELRKFPFVDREKHKPRNPHPLLHLWRRIHRRFLQKYLPADPRWRGLDATYPTFGGKITGAAGIRWVPDFQHIHLPEFFTDEERAGRDKGVNTIAQERGVLVLSSQSAERDFRTHWPDAKIDTKVWHFASVITQHEKNGADPHQKYGIPNRYVYIANQFWAHKNHAVAFRALKQLVDEGSDMVMVCTGREEDYRNASHMGSILQMIDEYGLQSRIMRLGLVPRPDQIEIFRHASIVLQPSLFEGWSTVIEDAKAIGRPVIASDIDVHREQFSEEPCYCVSFFPARDEKALASQLRSAWSLYPAGPDHEAEIRANRRNESRQLAAARTFMAIASHAIAVERQSAIGA